MTFFTSNEEKGDVAVLDMIESSGVISVGYIAAPSESVVICPKFIVRLASEPLRGVWLPRSESGDGERIMRLHV